MPKKETTKRAVIILPTYNEAENITPLVEKLLPIISSEKLYEFYILFVDDNSPDGTAEVVKRLTKKYPTIHLITGQKKGLGVAYIRGMHYAVDRLGADILFEMDSDLSHDPALISQFLRKIEEGYDLVVGSRYIPGGSIPADWPFSRKLMSVIGNKIVRYGLMIPWIHEWSNGYRALKSNVFEKISPGLQKYAGYTFQIAMLHRTKLAGFRITEIPCEFVDRTWGKSKFAVMDYIPNVLKYIALHSSFVRFFITGLIGFIIDFTLAYIFIHSFYLFKPTANALSGEIAIMVNFIINNFWSFNHKRISGGKRMFARKFAQFNFVALGAISIQFVGMYIALSLFGDSVIPFGTYAIPSWILYKIFIIALFLVPYSYFMYNRFIWRSQE